MDNNLKNARYVEPSEYIPKEIRKKLKLGEYAEQKAGSDRKAPAKKTPAKKN